MEGVIFTHIHILNMHKRIHLVTILKSINSAFEFNFGTKYVGGLSEVTSDLYTLQGAGRIPELIMLGQRPE